MQQPVIEIQNLIKKYDEVVAVNDVSFQVQAGEIFGLIGPDGAGKTSIIRILVSLLNPDSGLAIFRGKDVTKNTAYVRSHIGYMPQRFSLYQDLTVEENLNFFGDLFTISKDIQKERKEKLYNFSKLGPFKNRRAGALSGGMKQKLALSCMLMHEPEVIVLDEPTFGVDPVSREEFWENLKNLAANGTAILVTTAYMDEALLCDRVGLIFSGKILAIEKPQNLIRTFNEDLYLLHTNVPHITYEQLQNTNFSESVNLFGDGVHISDVGKLGLNKIKEELTKLNITYESIEEIQPEMEDLFLKLMKS